MIDIGNSETSLKPSLIITPVLAPEALSEKECKDILNLISEAADLGSDDFEYKFKAAILPYSDETANIYGRIYDLVKIANEEAYFFDPLDMVEHMMYCEFNEGDFIKWHTDMGPEEPQVGRKVGIVVNLSDSDDYRGGDLQFNTGHLIDCPRSMGTIIMYPGFLLQQTTPITKGTRKILIAWFGGTNLK